MNFQLVVFRRVEMCISFQEYTYNELLGPRDNLVQNACRGPFPYRFTWNIYIWQEVETVNGTKRTTGSIRDISLCYHVCARKHAWRDADLYEPHTILVIRSTPDEESLILCRQHSSVLARLDGVHFAGTSVDFGTWFKVRTGTKLHLSRNSTMLGLCTYSSFREYAVFCMPAYACCV
jgi:hypothetical protein